MIRHAAVGLVLAFALLILIAEVQRYDDLAEATLTLH